MSALGAKLVCDLAVPPFFEIVSGPLVRSLKDVRCFLDEKSVALPGLPPAMKKTTEHWHKFRVWMLNSVHGAASGTHKESLSAITFRRFVVVKPSDRESNVASVAIKVLGHSPSGEQSLKG
jgi:hypothetical protein